MTAGVLMAPAARSQPTTKVWRIGWLGNVAPNTPDATRLGAAFRESLAERGFVDGRNVAYEYRFGEGDVRRYPMLARELVARDVDIVVVTSGPAAVRALQDANALLPIVFIGLSSPVGLGLVQSLARPGGNITGVSDYSADLIPKRIELLKAAAARVRRIVMVSGTLLPTYRERLATITDAQQAVARANGVTIMRVEIASRDDLARAIALIEAEHPDALLLNPQPITFILRHELADYGLRARLPIMAPAREWVSTGALMSYGTEHEDVFRKAAGYVARILKGARPGELAIEEPTKFELVINLKSAHAIGLAIPQNLLLRADHTIDQ